MAQGYDKQIKEVKQRGEKDINALLKEFSTNLDKV